MANGGLPTQRTCTIRGILSRCKAYSKGYTLYNDLHALCRDTWTHLKVYSYT